MASGWLPDSGSWRWRTCFHWPGSSVSVQRASRWLSVCWTDFCLSWRFVNAVHFAYFLKIIAVVPFSNIHFPISYRFSQSTFLVSVCAAFTSLWSPQKKRRTCLWPMTWFASVRIALQCLTWWGWRRSSWRSSTGRWRPPRPCAFSVSFTATSWSSSTLRGKDRRSHQPAGQSYDSTRLYLLY